MGSSRKNKDYDEGYNLGYDEGFEGGRAAALEERGKRHPEAEAQRIFDVRIQRSVAENRLIWLMNFFLIVGLVGWIFGLVFFLANVSALLAGLAGLAAVGR